MCTRFYTERDDPELSVIGEAALNSPLAQRFYRADGGAILTHGEIRPSNIAPVIACSKSGNRTVFPMKWGFNIPVEHKTVPKLVVNAGAQAFLRRSVGVTPLRCSRFVVLRVGTLYQPGGQILRRG